MKRIKRWLHEMFSPQEFNGLDFGLIAQAFNDATVRRLWLEGIVSDLETMNKEVDRRLLTDSTYGIADLCARRKAYQDVLEAVLSARRKVMQEVRPNPKDQMQEIDLDRVTA